MEIAMVALLIPAITDILYVEEGKFINKYRISFS